MMARPPDHTPLMDRFAPIERTVLAEDIAHRMLELIEDGRLQPRERLPPERELASLLGVSRPSLREALRALQLMNVVEVRHGEGTYVSSLDAAELAEPLGLFLRLRDASYLEVLEARRCIEPAIAALAADRISEEELSRLDSCLDTAKESVHSPGDFLQTDLELHAIVVEASHNPLLTGLMASISSLGVVTRQRTAYIPGVRETALRDHSGIVGAIRGRDPKASYEAMERHISHIEEALREASMATKASERSEIREDLLGKRERASQYGITWNIVDGREKADDDR